ncbi:MAG TPA: hypothetical protein VGE39_19075, partial [Prosthecobacter sp.]
NETLMSEPEGSHLIGSDWIYQRLISVRSAVQTIVLVQRIRAWPMSLWVAARNASASPSAMMVGSPSPVLSPNLTLEQPWQGWGEGILFVARAGFPG